MGYGGAFYNPPIIKESVAISLFCFPVSLRSSSLIGSVVSDQLVFSLYLCVGFAQLNPADPQLQYDWLYLRAQIGSVLSSAS